MKAAGQAGSCIWCLKRILTSTWSSVVRSESEREMRSVYGQAGWGNVFTQGGTQTDRRKQTEEKQK